MPDRASDNQYAGHVRCSCGCDVFEMRHTGGTRELDGETIPCVAKIDGEFYLRIMAICVGCHADHLLFDMDFHGWEGVVCHDPSKAQRPRPSLTAWPCRTCGALNCKADVVVSGEDAETAIEEAEGELDASNWQEGFGWVDIHLQCDACGEDHVSWISYETM